MNLSQILDLMHRIISERFHFATNKSCVECISNLEGASWPEPENMLLDIKTNIRIVDIMLSSTNNKINPLHIAYGSMLY